VATDIPAHREALSPFSPICLTLILTRQTKITEILAKSDLAKDLGRAGRAFVTKHYNSSSCLKALEDYYVSWLDSGKGRQ
jgi:hypothetical protein